MTQRMTVQKANETVAASKDGLYGVLRAHGSMELGYYVPSGSDKQTPHDQDEIYIVQEGSGTFCLGGEAIEFSAGDALFVPAGVEHRFENFSDNFGAWVIFYGADGGESCKK